VAEGRYQPRLLAGSSPPRWAVNDTVEDVLVREGKGHQRRTWTTGDERRVREEARRLNALDRPKQPAPNRTRPCPSCGEERSILFGFPRGPEQPCRRCLFGPRPRARFVQGGAPGMGRLHGKRR